uniref:Pentatricopeptide repeat-containing protein At5g48910-like n=1 Tax=Elaeis guineensis var. tenera TaxID=51953 RepID=A0A6I9QE14_ELAGV|nr:pentatricopeptide repeat-containing protein At5g48910-like [Elaeis guineensis]
MWTASQSLPLLLAPNAAISLLDKCHTLSELRQVHARLVKSGLASNPRVLRRLLLCRARSPNVSFLSDSNNVHECFLLYSRMLSRLDDLHGVEFSLPSLLKTCGKSSSFFQGRQLHAQVLKTHFQSDPFVFNSILRMYLDFNELETARQVFDRMNQRDVISWNSMIAGCLKAGDVDLALALFDEMPQKDIISWNSMIDGLMKCERCDLAEKLFESMAQRDVVTWTAMVSGYVLNGHSDEALELFRRMLDAGVQPDATAIVNVLAAIADLGFCDEGKWVHAYVCRSNIKLVSGVLGSALIDMYSKCGLIDNALSVFRSICHERQVGDWNSMISGLAIHGLGRQAIEIFDEMQRIGVEPNDISFLGLLKACSHSGMIEEGWLYFKLMQERYRMEPGIQHYGCLIDLLSRSGLLEEAQRVIEDLPMEPDVVVWKSILSSCVRHGHVDIGEHAAMRVIELAPHDSSCYTLLSNMYAKFGQWEDVERVRALMKERGVKKIPGCSCIMVKGEVHEFLVGKEMGVGRREVVHSKLEEVIHRLKLQGYEPDLSQVLVDVEEEEKESLLSVHSEKMAIAFGLLNLNKGAPIRIVKNLRVCGDCHSFSKLVSRIYNHEIILRDQNRFHHFKGGSCSCNDYW